MRKVVPQSQRPTQVLSTHQGRPGLRGCSQDSEEQELERGRRHYGQDWPRVGAYTPPLTRGPNAGTVSCGGAGRAGGGESRAPARLHFNWRRQGTAPSPRPGGEPRAVQNPSARGGDPSDRLAGWLRRAGRAQPEGVNATVYLAYCTHVCAGLACAAAARAVPVTAPEPLEPGPSLGIRAGEGSFACPSRGRGGGAWAALWEVEPGGVAGGSQIKARREGGWGPTRWGAVTLRCG